MSILNSAVDRNLDPIFLPEDTDVKGSDFFTSPSVNDNNIITLYKFSNSHLNGSAVPINNIPRSAYSQSREAFISQWGNENLAFNGSAIFPKVHSRDLLLWCILNSTGNPNQDIVRMVRIRADRDDEIVTAFDVFMMWIILNYTEPEMLFKVQSSIHFEQGLPILRRPVDDQSFDTAVEQIYEELWNNGLGKNGNDYGSGLMSFNVWIEMMGLKEKIVSPGA